MGRQYPEALMAQVEKISVALTAEMATMVRKAVESGEYATASEVIRDALRLWKQEQILREHEIAELRAAWEEGIASGPAEPWDAEEFLNEARARLLAEQDGSS